MLAISLKTILEQIAAERHGEKRSSGNIADFGELMQPENLERLDAAFDAFAFLAFHPGGDAAVRSYVEAGTLGSDSGKRLLALFSLGEEATWPTVVSRASFGDWIDVETTMHPAYEMVTWLFEPEPSPPLPGVALFRSMAGEDEVVYVGLGDAHDTGLVRERLRTVFALAHAAVTAGTFADHLGAALQRDRIAYEKTGRKSVREVLIRSSQVARDHASDIVAVAGLLV
jgi:hypothetical protein